MENLKNLVQVGENLLKKPVSRINMDTGRYEPVVNGGTNEEALKKYFPSHLFYIYKRLKSLLISNLR